MRYGWELSCYFVWISHENNMEIDCALNIWICQPFVNAFHMLKSTLHHIHIIHTHPSIDTVALMRSNNLHFIKFIFPISREKKYRPIMFHTHLNRYISNTHTPPKMCLDFCCCAREFLFPFPSWCEIVWQQKQTYRIEWKMFRKNQWWNRLDFFFRWAFFLFSIRKISAYIFREGNKKNLCLCISWEIV